MNLISVLENPPLDSQLIIHYMKGKKVHLKGKDALFIQIEFYSRMSSVSKSLKDICDDLWSSATITQKRKFDFMAREVNSINKSKRRQFHQRNTNDIIDGISLP